MMVLDHSLDDEKKLLYAASQSKRKPYFFSSSTDLGLTYIRCVATAWIQHQFVMSTA